MTMREYFQYCSLVLISCKIRLYDNKHSKTVKGLFYSEMSIWKTVLPGRLSKIDRWPLWLRMICRQRLNPIPVPSDLVVKNGMNTFSCRIGFSWSYWANCWHPNKVSAALRSQSMVLYSTCIADAVYLICDSGFPDNENNNEQTCSFITIWVISESTPSDIR